MRQKRPKVDVAMSGAVREMLERQPKTGGHVFANPKTGGQLGWVGMGNVGAVGRRGDIMSGDDILSRGDKTKPPGRPHP